MPNGFINVLKTPGVTSHDVVSHLRRVYGIKKIGHAGTLDPAAAGVLPIAVGKATRMLEYIDDVSKSYKVELLFGIETNTGDDTGEVIQSMDYTMPSEEEILRVLETFKGTIRQRPPIFSAIKINGQKAYKLARNNVEVEIPEREVTIHSIDFQECTSEGFVFSVHCSKGTYIRSLCRDIGEKLGVCATMKFLLRTHVGEFKLANTWTVEEINMLPERALLPVDFPLGEIPKFELNDEEALMFKQGKKIHADVKECSSKNYIRLYNKGVFAGIGKYHADMQLIAPHKVLL